MKEILVNIEKNRKIIILIEDYKIAEIYEESDSEGNSDIYLGTVQNIIPGLKAIFVDIGEKKNAFLSFDDLYKRYSKIKINDKILAQKERKSLNKKGAKITTNIKLIGRAVVLTPKTNFVTSSVKIEDEKIKKELINYVRQKLPEGVGAIVRTNATNLSHEEIEEDIQKLINSWENIQKKDLINANVGNIYQNCSILEKLILAEGDSGLNRILINDKNELENVKEYLKKVNLDKKIKLEYEKNILEKYTIKKEIEDLNKSKIWLKCGGYIVIDKTEALTVIDVNSGKFAGKGDLESNIFKLDTEATIEVARQLRLKNIGGIIIVDYVNMKNDDDKKRIMEIFEKEIKKDRSKVQVEGFTKLNLLEITRKKIS